MKIWLINHYAVPPKYYPLARQNNFARYLMGMGHSVKIFAASTVHNSNLNLIEGDEEYIEINDDGVEYVLVKCQNYSGNGLSRIKNMQEFANKLKSVCEHFEKPDAIVSTSMPPMSCAAGVKLAKKYGCKSVAEIADLWPESIIAYGIAGKNNPAVLYLRRLEKWIYKNADKVVFTMEGAYEYIKDQGWEKEIPESKVFYINNGVDLDQFDYNKEHYTVDDEDLNNPETFKIVYTGSIRKVNNMGQVVDAAKLITNPRIKFLIWGAGDEEEVLRKRVIDEKIENVVFKGRVDKKYVPYITSKCDLGIFHIDQTSIVKYGLSLNKMFDYLAAGIPVLSDCKTDYNPSINYNAGFTTGVPGAEKIAELIENVLNMDKSQYDSYKVNARKAAESYDFKVLTNKLVEVIEK